MTGQPIYLTVLREGDLVAIDLATVDPVMPRSRLQASESLLREICGEIARIGSATQQTVHTSWAAQQRHQPLSTSPSEELKAVGRIIFSHLFPKAVRYHLSHSPSTDLFLRLDEQLVHVPWELGFDGQDFLLTKFRIGRQVLTRATSGRSYEDHACLEVPLRMLIILDPTETLAGAEDEAHELCTLLDQSQQVDVVIMGGHRINKLDLLRALNETDLVHYAGHAIFDPTRPGESGWLLQEGILTSSEISHLESPPLLVFSNACQAGATEHWAGSPRFEGEAFGLGSGFLLAGVRHYIGSLWAIHDKRSVGFAHVFYQQLLQGHSVGEALLEARHWALTTYGWEELLWAGYLHYGMPSDRIPIPVSASTGADVDPSWSCQRAPSPAPQSVLPEASREAEAALVTVPPSMHGEDRGARRWRLRTHWRPISLVAAVGLSVLLFVWVLVAWNLAKFPSPKSFEPHSPMMQSLLDRYQRAYMEFQNGQIDRALAEFRVLVASRENPQGLGYDGLAATYFEAELADKAVELLDEALRRFPQHAIAHLLRGDILYTQGRTADALPAYREATSGVAVFPWQRAAAQTGIGVFYGLQGAWDHAKAAFTEAVAADPSSPTAYANLGYLARQEGKADEAKHWFDSASALNPTDEVTLYYRELLQKSTKLPSVWNSRKGRVLIFPFVYVGGNLQRLGTGEMLASLVGEALVEDERMAVLAGRDLAAALQGNSSRFSSPSDLPAAINVAKVLGADILIYGSHRHYTNVLAVDARAVHVKTMEVLTSEHLKSHGTDKIRAASQALAAKLRLVLADAVQQPMR